MRRRTAKNELARRSARNGKYLPTRRIVWLVAILVAASLAEGSLAAVASRSDASHGGAQIFRVKRLAPTRGG